MKNSPPNFNESKTTDETTRNFKKSFKKVKFDKSVEIQQLTFKEEREHQKRIKAELDEKLMAERIEQLKMDEMYRKINGIPFEGKFNSPIPMDPFQKDFDAEIIGNSSPFSLLSNQIQRLNFDSSNFNSSLTNSSSPGFSSSNNFNNSKPRISGKYKMRSTRFNSSRFNSSNPYESPKKNNFLSSKGFGNSKREFSGSVSISFVFFYTFINYISFVIH
uniref:Uncharacterized protein n=1 Tax=Panagrolaimus sp. PS1159 TaxID=55785 RepID=A0AC35F5G5_9BILA